MDINTALEIDKFEYRDIELGDLGPTLPVGIFTEDGTIEEFSLLPYLGKHELKLGQLEDENQDHPNRVNRILAGFLPHIIDCFGDWQIQDLAHYLKTSASRLIGQMYAGDVLSLALYLRWRNLGGDLAIRDVCPACGYKVNNRKSEEELSYHDLSTLRVRVWEKDFPPVICASLEKPISIGGKDLDRLYFEPLRFSQLPKLRENPTYCYDDRLLLACGRTFLGGCLGYFTSDIFNLLSRSDLRHIRKAVNLLYLGPERTLDIDCPSCAAEWQRILTYGRDGSEYELFYSSLLSPPRIKNKPGAVEEYLNEVNYVFNYGEDAPKIDVYEITPATREFWLKKIEETRKKQKEEMDKAANKSKSRSR